LRSFDGFLFERTGPVWLKLHAEKGSGGLWATDLIRQAGGQHSVIIPDIVPGDYLLRGGENGSIIELISHDQAFS